MEQTDEMIAQLVQKGDIELFGVLIDRYEKRLAGYLKRFLRERTDITDIVQDIFIKAYTNIQSFDTTQQFSSWIYRIAHNEAVNFIKKKRSLSFSFFDPDYLINYFKDKDNVGENIERIETKKEIEQVLDDIPPHHKEILLLFFYEELSYKEISDVLKIPISSVGVKINRAKKVVEDILSKKQTI